MEFLHSLKMAHRDLRSPNVLICSLDPKVFFLFSFVFFFFFFLQAPTCAKVSDFGLTISVTERLHDPLGAWQW
jgi:serine/threonine protein kinase